MKNSKKIIVIALVMILAFSLAACGTGTTSSEASSAAASSSDSAVSSGDAQEQETRTFFVNPKMVGAAYWQSAKEGALQAGEDLGVEVVWNGTESVDVAKQINMITDMITRNVDGMAVAVNDSTSVTNVFNDAKEAGIPVITFDADSSGAERQYYIAGDSNEGLAIEMTEVLMAEMPEHAGKIAITIASASAANEIGKRDAALKYIEENYPDIEVVGVWPDDDDQQKAYENAKSILQAHPDLAGFLCLDAGGLCGSVKVVQEAIEAGQIEKGQIQVGGQGIPSLVKQYMEDGTMTLSMMWNPYSLGYLSVWVLNEIAQGNEIVDGTEVPGVGNIKVDGDVIYTGTFRFTIDNIDDYNF